MGQRLDVRRRDGQHRVPKPGELYALALGNQLEVGGRRVQGAGLGLGDRQLGLGVAAEHPLAESALSGLVGQLDLIGAVPLNGDDGDGLPRNHPSETRAGLEILKLGHGRLRVDRIGFGSTVSGSLQRVDARGRRASQLITPRLPLRSLAALRVAGVRRRHVAPKRRSLLGFVSPGGKVGAPEGGLAVV